MNLKEFFVHLGHILGIIGGNETITTSLTTTGKFDVSTTPMILEISSTRFSSTEEPSSLSSKFLSSLSTGSPYETTEDHAKKTTGTKVDSTVVTNPSAQTGTVTSSKVTGTGSSVTGSAGTDPTVKSTKVTVTGSPVTGSTGTGSTVTGSKVTVTGSPVTGSTVTGSPVTGSTVTGSPVTGSTVTGSPVTGSTVTGSPVTGSTVTGSPVTGSTVTGSPVTGSTVTGSPVTGSTGTGSTVTGTEVTGTASVTGPTVPPTSKPDGLSRGAVAAIVVGSLLGVAIITAAIVFVVKQRNAPEARRLNV